LDSWRQYLTKLIQLGLVVPAGQASPYIRGWFVWLFFSLLLVTVLTATLLIYTEVRRREAENEKNERRTKAFKTLQGMMRAASRIRDQLTPPAAKIVKSLDKVEVIYLVHKDFTTEVHREYHVRAMDQPLHFWTVGNRATGHATPVDYWDDIDFKVSGGDGRELVYLPTENDPLAKQVIIYFLPRIEPGEEHPRKVIVTYKWPRLLAQLKELQEEDFSLTFDSKEPIKAVELAIYLEPGAGRNLVCEVSGPNYEGAKLEAKKHPDLNWPGYAYTVKNAPAGRSRFALTARLKDA